MSIRDEVITTQDKQVVAYNFTDMNEIMEEIHGIKWTNYRRQWIATSDINNISDIPLYLLLELNSFCNLRCKMCKHANDDNIKANRRSMPMDIFYKIMDETKDLKIPSINIGTGTECTLHPNFKEIALNVKKTGAIDKFFLTNGSTLSDEMIKNIFDGEYERVEISMDAATSNTYTKIRINGNYHKLETMVLKLISEKQKRKSKLPLIRLSFCVQDDNINEIELFYEKWKNKVDMIEYQKISKPNQTGGVPKLKRCYQPYNRLSIDYNGNIYPCCSILYQNSYCIGNIKDISIYEAWHGEKMQALRKGFESEKMLHHCKECLLSIYGEEI